MILICDSRTDRSRWVVAENGEIIESADTSGLNPYFKSRREISHVIRLELPESFFKYRYDKIYFYGSGCGTPEKCKVVESSLIAQFKCVAEVNSDLLGAARAMLQHDAGIACILSMGTNSCFYDGEDIAEHVRSGGYLLGDEGSDTYMGKLLVSDIIKDIAPAEVSKAFYEKFHVSVSDVLDDLYTHPNTNLLLSDYSLLLPEQLHHRYCRDLVYNAFMTFFKRNIAFYDYRKYPISVVGRTVFRYKEIFMQAAADFGITISDLAFSSVYGLAKFHTGA